MISIPKSAVLSAVSQVVPNAVRASVPGVVQKGEKYVVRQPKTALTHFSMSDLLPKNALRATSGLASSNQVRFAHTDIPVPDFSFYRRDGVKDSHQSSQNSVVARRSFTYMIVGGGSVTAAYAAKNIVTDIVSTLSASADVLALAKIEIKLSEIPEGKNVTFKWRGKPLFVRHRTAEEIEVEQGVDLGTLRHAEHDNERTTNPEWLVLLGVCTHLGCVPIANAGDFGGYYCPCHGSHYDASGRIRKGPAPLNLEVPVYSFPDEGTLIVG
ncbi:cytochrome b-c1 complex subunit Rieske, mitochondrial-like [Haliotis rufescens]|uniref:cytochrome b-c1 complex subunit Rieske, mitochondrial-like n=1 Tax=Haliotis rufescens TaxID=6454 RepID=UPI001EB08D63|nr:cytochrome b-c1 complex subunit Rieske, mitochondrial-like [Haliotis rufescens]